MSKLVVLPRTGTGVRGGHTQTSVFSMNNITTLFTFLLVVWGCLRAVNWILCTIIFEGRQQKQQGNVGAEKLRKRTGRGGLKEATERRKGVGLEDKGCLCVVHRLSVYVQSVQERPRTKSTSSC